MWTESLILLYKTFISIVPYKTKQFSKRMLTEPQVNEISVYSKILKNNREKKVSFISSFFVSTAEWIIINDRRPLLKAGMIQQFRRPPD